MNPTFISLPCQISTQQILHTKTFFTPPPFICKRPWKSWKSRNRSWANFLQSLSIPLICYSGLNTEGIEAVLCLDCNRNIILDRLCLLFETNKKRCIFCNCLSKILSSLRETQSALAKFWDDFCTCFAIFYFCLNSVIHCSIQTQHCVCDLLLSCSVNKVTGLWKYKMKPDGIRK